MEVDLKGVYVSQRYSSLSSSERDLPGFFVIDSTAKYEVARDLSVFVSCKNLLDERGAYKRKGYPISGRVVEGGLTIKF
jgi:outer membrane receptor protein involved in Fe transport